MSDSGFSRFDRQKSLFGCLLFTTLSLAIIVPSRAKSLLSLNIGSSEVKENNQEQCLAATNVVINEIGSFGTPVYLYKSNEANRYHSGNPSNRQGYMSFALGNLRGAKGYTLVFATETKPPKLNHIIANVMVSGVLQKKWANFLANECSDLAVFSISEANTDSVVEYAIQTDSTMRPRDCVDPDTSPRILGWNEKVCL
jgi:hypothetical protein